MAAEGQFLELEKRFAAFKFVFGRLQTSYLKPSSEEFFGTSHAIYLDSLVTGVINSANDGGGDNTILPARTRTWTKGTHAGTALDDGENSSDDLWAGSFQTTIHVDSANPNVEKVIIPLIKMGATDSQAYFAYQFEGDEIGANLIINQAAKQSTPETGAPNIVEVNDTYRAYNSVIDRNSFFDLDGRRLKRFIDPVRFGADYKVKIQPSNADRTGPADGDFLSETDATPTQDQSMNGWAFDYNEGMLYIAPFPGVEVPNFPQFNQPSADRPCIPARKHPLWLTAYRYIGPTGSNMSVTSAGSAGSAGSGGGGVSTTLVSVADSIANAYDVNEFGWYDKNTFTATDSEDIIEYVATDGTVLVSASFGERDLVVRLDSSSYNDITETKWNYFAETQTAVYNGNSLFKFTGSQHPDYSSYALYQTNPATNDYITQSFNFSSKRRLDKIGICFSDNTNIDLSTSPIQESILYKYIAGFILEGSNDGITYTPIANASNIRGSMLSSPATTYGPIGIPFQSFGSGNSDGSERYWSNDNSDANGPVHIYCATASINDINRYQYYKLYVSGGAEIQDAAGDYYEMALHHVDLWENIDFGPTNRKQLHVKFNDALSARLSSVDSQPFTEFDLAVSESARRIGYVKVIPEDLATFSEGNIPGDVTFGGEVEFNGPANRRNLKGLTSITSSFISASTKLIAGDIIANGTINAVSMSGNGDAITFNNITNSDTLTTKKLIVQDNFQVNSDVIVPSDKSIFLTNKRQDGTDGTDDFSARIFGNFTQAGVSDMYLDAYRIYNVADAKVHIRTLHPTLGTIVLESPLTYVSGALSASHGIQASSFTASKALITNGVTISGSVLISGSIIPNTDTSLISSFDLGSSTAAWRDIHVSDGTIRFYDGTSERANISLGTNSEVQFKTGDNFQDIRVGELNVGPAIGSSVQISDNGRGFIAVSKNGSHATILRAEDQALGDLGADMVHGSLTQKGSGSFAIILDANNQNQARSKFSVISNSEAFSAAQVLFQVSESGETKVHGYLNVSQSVTAYDISANSFTGTFVGALSSSAQIAENVSGSFNVVSSSFNNRLTVVETELNNTLISGSSQIATEISGAFATTSASLELRITSVEAGSTSKTLISGSAQIATSISGAFDITSASLASQIDIINTTQSTLTAKSIFNDLTASVNLKADISALQYVLNATGSYAITGSDVTFGEITATKLTGTVVTASNLHTTIFNPAIIDTTAITASLSNLGTISNTRTFTTDDHNTLLAADTRPALTVRNAGGGDITYFGSPVDNADAFIKFQTDRSNTKFSVGVDSHDSAFKITEAETLNENTAGSTGFPTFKIIDNKVGIVKSTVSYTLDVGGDIRSSGVMRVDTIRPQTYGAFGTPLPYNSLTLSASVTASGDIIASGTVSATSFVGDGTSLTGIATIGNVVANTATASFLTDTSAIDGGSF